MTSYIRDVPRFLFTSRIFAALGLALAILAVVGKITNWY